jgi:secreted trypsin-like serine protease
MTDLCVPTEFVSSVITGEYPWQAAILKKDVQESVYVCGGTLIDSLHVLTAAHCVKTLVPYSSQVRSRFKRERNASGVYTEKRRRCEIWTGLQPSLLYGKTLTGLRKSIRDLGQETSCLQREIQVSAPLSTSLETLILPCLLRRQCPWYISASERVSGCS